MVLAKTLKPRHIELIALGGIIGSCFFLGTGYVLVEVGPAAILAYILAGYYRICGDFVLSRTNSRFPKFWIIYLLYC